MANGFDYLLVAKNYWKDYVSISYLLLFSPWSRRNNWGTEWSGKDGYGQASLEPELRNISTNPHLFSSILILRYESRQLYASGICSSIHSNSSYTLDIHCAFAYIFSDLVALHAWMCAWILDNAILEGKPYSAHSILIFLISLPLSWTLAHMCSKCSGFYVVFTNNQMESRRTKINFKRIPDEIVCVFFP